MLNSALASLNCRRSIGHNIMRDVKTVCAVTLATATLSAAVLMARRWATKQRRPPVGSRVVFLDIDGVLNRTQRAAQVTLVPELVKRLKAIVERGGRPCTRTRTSDYQHCDCGASQVEQGAANLVGDNNAPAQIILSTFWRPFEGYVAYIIDRHGVCGNLVAGATPGDPSVLRSVVRHLLHPDSITGVPKFKTRAAEIRYFLEQNPQVTHFVILDDRVDAADAELLAHFIQTDPSVGLTDGHVAQALELLKP